MAQTPRRVGGLRLAGRVGRTRLLVILAMVGPGFIAANAGNDAGGITTWSVIGSRYGYSMIWLLVLITPVLAIVQEMNARVGVVTGRGLAGLIRENFSLKITALAILATVIANFGTTVAEFSGVAAASEPLPRAALRRRTRGRRRRLAARHPRLVPQGGARAPRPRLRAADLRRLRHPRRARLERGAPRRDAPVHPVEQPLDLHRRRRRRHDAHALGPVLHPGGRGRQEGAVEAVRLHQVRDLCRLACS